VLLAEAACWSSPRLSDRRLREVAKLAAASALSARTFSTSGSSSASSVSALAWVGFRRWCRTASAEARLVWGGWPGARGIELRPGIGPEGSGGLPGVVLLSTGGAEGLSACSPELGAASLIGPLEVAVRKLGGS